VFGKVLGAMIGAGVGFLAMSLPAALVLAVVGAILGHLYESLHAAPDLWDEGIRPPPRPDRPSPPSARPPPPKPVPESSPAQEAKERYAKQLCTLFVELARVDGEVVREEVRVMREYFQQDLGFEGSALNRVRNQLKAAIASSAELDDAARKVRDALEPSARAFLLDALYDLALADGELKRSEQDALRKLASVLEVGEEAHRKVTERYFGKGETHFAKLGLTSAATDEEIRAAFKKLAAQHHPDKVASQGPKAVEAANRRFLEIKDAYEELRRLRGI